MKTLRGPALAAAIVVAGGAAGVAACIEPSDGSSVSHHEQRAALFDRADWLEKASRVLRGEGLGPRDDVDSLMAMSRDAVVDTWMADPRFGDRVLAFNLYYLGHGSDRVKDPLPGGGFRYRPAAIELARTVAAAKAVTEGGNYFELFSDDPPAFPQDNGAAPSDAGTGGDAHFAEMLDAAITLVSTDRAQGCIQFLQAASGAIGRLSARGFTSAGALRSWLRPNAAFPRTVDCSSGSTVPTERLIESMRTVRAAVQALFVGLDATRPGRVRSVGDLLAIRVRFEGFPPVVPALGQGFFRELPASSTNFQRKRAAHVLKTYFCDDLTPLTIPAAAPGGEDHGSDVHASNPTCQSCHYRLDPMGALFRQIGKSGQDFSEQPSIKFDDDVVFEGQRKDAYLGQWRNADGTYRAGYWVLGRDGKPQREPGWTDADGNTLSGLFSYLRRSSIAKSCLVRRLAEYVLGPEQVYDREWLDEIARGFHDGAESGAAFKAMMKALVLSRTFATHDPETGVCYDAPTNAPPNRSPCAIAHVISTNCVGCHSSVEGFGHVDFSTWTDVGGGTYSWVHHDGAGRQLSRSESLRRILDRVTATDVGKRMPLQRSMSQDDFATLTTWLRSTLEGTEP